MTGSLALPKKAEQDVLAGQSRIVAMPEHPGPPPGDPLAILVDNMKMLETDIAHAKVRDAKRVEIRTARDARDTRLFLLDGGDAEVNRDEKLSHVIGEMGTQLHTDEESVSGLQTQMDHSLKEDTQTDDDTVDENVAVDLQVQSLLAKEQQPARPVSLSQRRRKKGLGSKAAKPIMGDIMVEEHTVNLLGKMQEKMRLEAITRLLPGIMTKNVNRERALIDIRHTTSIVQTRNQHHHQLERGSTSTGRVVGADNPLNAQWWWDVLQQPTQTAKSRN